MIFLAPTMVTFDVLAMASVSEDMMFVMDLKNVLMDQMKE